MERVLGVNPIPLHVSPITVGQEGTLVGFGLSGTFATGADESTLRKVGHPPTRRAGTTSIASMRAYEPDCLQTRVRDLDVASDLEAFGATGDSGGPFLIRTEAGVFVAGLIRDNFGASDDGVIGNRGDSNGILRISVYAPWIEDTTGLRFGAPRLASRSLILIIVATAIIVAVISRRKFTAI